MVDNERVNLVFYFPYKFIGGVSVLFLRIANVLSKKYNIYLMDLEDGYMHKNIPNNVGFISIENPEKIPSNSILIFQSIAPWRIKKIESFPHDAKFIYWNLHPYNLNSNIFIGPFNNFFKKIVGSFLNYISFVRKNKMLNFIQYLTNNNALYFMDAENYNKTNAFYDYLLDSSPTYIPILSSDNIIPTDNMFFKKGLTIKDTFNCLWIGRVEDFKIPILKHTIKRLDNLGKSKNINLTIVGGGNQLKEVIMYSEQFKNISCQFLGNVDVINLPNLIKEHDILFAMGTSALEGAKLGIPTICLDYSYVEIEGLYKYTYLFDRTKYVVGEEISSQHKEDLCSLDDILYDLNINYISKSIRCYDYWKENHSPVNVISILEDNLFKTTACFGDVINGDFCNVDKMTRFISFFLSLKDNASGFISR